MIPPIVGAGSFVFVVSVVAQLTLRAASNKWIIGGGRPVARSGLVGHGAEHIDVVHGQQRANVFHQPYIESLALACVIVVVQHGGRETGHHHEHDSQKTDGHVPPRGVSHVVLTREFRVAADEEDRHQGAQAEECIQMQSSLPSF